HRFCVACDETKQGNIREVSGTYLEGRNAQRCKKSRARLVERGRKKLNPRAFACAVDLCLFIFVECQMPEHLDLGPSSAPRSLLIRGEWSGSGRQVLRIERLELDRVGTGFFRNANHLQRAIHVALVVDTRFGHHIAGRTISDDCPTDVQPQRTSASAIRQSSSSSISMDFSRGMMYGRGLGPTRSPVSRTFRGVTKIAPFRA